MIIKTKKVTLNPEEYFRISLKKRLIQDWWVLSFILIIFPISIILSKYWILVLYIIGMTLYVGFWAVQYWGVRYLDQMQLLFAPVYYEISSSGILVKLSSTTGFNLEWKTIKNFHLSKKNYILNVSLAQFIYIPFKCFNSSAEQAVFEKILQSKVKKRDNVLTKILNLYAKFRGK